ncbi:hypothetical protein Tco_1030919 [Tanacetum coccineum]|uniref:Reverse transcriptase domain-containing protein n=1 Tax=Tanacetum coccineum TaxID=301880 RepID=A0ABQ5G968_9ASTR
MRTRSQARRRRQPQVRQTSVESSNLEKPDNPPIVTMADNRTMAQLLEAPTEELHQLDTFYNSLNSIDQDSLNSAAGGNFLDKMPRECLKIIESKSKVRALILDKEKNQTPAISAPVKAVEQSCVTCGGGHSYQNCPATNSNIYHDNIQEYVSQAAAANFNQANSGYRPPMVSNQIRPPGFPPIQNPHANSQNNFNRGNNFNQNRGHNSTKPMDAVYEKHAKTMVKTCNPNANMDRHAFKNVTANTAFYFRSGTLPGPKAVYHDTEMTREHRCLLPITEALKRSNLLRNDERRKEKANDQIEKFYEIFRDLSFEISFTDALMLMPKFASTLKTLIGNKEKLSELARTPLNENCSAVILNKLPKKLGDPGRFP